jgi:prepilin-type N-terminal cleavage/methylation domain-containing protein
MRKRTLTSSRRGRGFSLIELAVVLAISAAIGLTLWRLLPTMRATTGSGAGNTAKIDLSDAQQALEGYILRTNRLPRPDTGTTGFEDSESSTTQVGMLPYRTLGLGSDPKLRYGVYRDSSVAPALDADLAVKRERYTPTLPEPSDDVPANGLNFCVGLKNGIASPGALTVGTQAVPVAYALAHAGINGTFDGLNNSSLNFELAATPQSPSYDDRVLTTGLAELFGRLNCHERLSAAEGAARQAYAAFDVERSAALYQDFRTFAVEVRANSREFAIANDLIAKADLALTVADGVTAIAIAAQTGGIGAGVIAGNAIPTAAATFAAVAATVALAAAVLAVPKAEEQRTAAQVFRSNAAQSYSLAIARAKTVKSKGLLR